MTRLSEDQAVRIRGTRDGIVLILPPEISADEMLVRLREAITAGGDFFRDARVTLDYAERLPDRAEIERAGQLLADLGVRVRTVTATVPEFRAALRAWGFTPTRLTERAQPVVRRLDDTEHSRTATYIKRTLRSGASVESDGDLVVLGDVNPGAHVSAAGDVIVWGVLRGMVHAGHAGATDAVICALRLEPTQLRIGRHVARPPDGRQGRAPSGPQTARIEKDSIVVVPWK